MKDFEKILDRKKTPSLKYKKRKTKRTVTKESGIVPENALKGLVSGIIGTTILVETEKSGLFECSTAGVVVSKNENQSIVAVGDWVYFLPDEKHFERIGAIIKVDERKNHFSRKEVGYEKEDVIAANIDKLIIMLSVKSPKYNKRLLDRFLVTAELNGVEPIICINKIDLGVFEELKKDFQFYYNFKYKVYFISAKERFGLDELLDEISNSTCVLTGPSGSGKSTFINAILENTGQTVRETSNKTNKGKHTTSAVNMFALPNGGKIIDTPGVREFGIWGLEKNEVALYFHEFDEFNPQCKYYPCTHTHEPDCAVIEALEKGKIDLERYQSYLNQYDSLK
ncbi:MAG: ribosome small subunit-dependent GTPase A [bacterium]